MQPAANPSVIGTNIAFTNTVPTTNPAVIGTNVAFAKTKPAANPSFRGTRNQLFMSLGVTSLAKKYSITLCAASVSLCLCGGVVQAQKPGDAFQVEAREYLGTPKSEAAVKKGLEFLKVRQLPDGHWNSGNYTADAAISGLCTLAFLASGHQPGRGPYGPMLEKAVDYLADSVQRNGLVGRGGSAGPPMYGHGFATLALAELYGMTKRPDFRLKVENAIQLIASTQNSEGGWRYQPGSADADISVTAIQVVALR